MPVEVGAVPVEEEVTVGSGVLGGGGGSCGDSELADALARRDGAS